MRPELGALDLAAARWETLNLTPKPYTLNPRPEPGRFNLLERERESKREQERARERHRERQLEPRAKCP